MIGQVQPGSSGPADADPPPVRVCMHVLATARSDVRVMREARALVEAGFSVSIVDIVIAGEGAYPLEEEIDGVCVKHIFKPGTFVSNKRWTLFGTVGALVGTTLRLLKTAADVYHAHDEATLPACYLAARLRRKPCIFDAHEYPLHQWPLAEMSRGRRLLHELLKLLLAFIAPRCAKIITVSPLIGEALRSRYHTAHVTLVRNVPTYRAVTKSDRLRQALSLPASTRIALYQGGLMQNRSLDMLIRAARFLIEDTVIVMMGPCRPEMLSQLEALIAEEAVAERVKIIPAVPYAELLDWTASADIGLVVFSPDYSPSIQMCLPNKLFEYLMAGLPVLASSLEAVADVLHTYDAGQVLSSLTPQALGAAINAMLADRAALDRMGRNALHAAREDLCWEKECSRLIHLYREVLAPDVLEDASEAVGDSLHAENVDLVPTRDAGPWRVRG